MRRSQRSSFPIGRTRFPGSEGRRGSPAQAPVWRQPENDSAERLWHACKRTRLPQRVAEQPPPQARAVSTSDEFLKVIESFHDRGYTVRVPESLPLSPKLQRSPARSNACFISRLAARYSGAGPAQRRPFITTSATISSSSSRAANGGSSRSDPPGLQNNWQQVGEPLPHLQRHRVVDVEPGDLIYIPRGTPHTVELTTDSLHLAILFVPLTLRDAIIAAGRPPVGQRPRLPRDGGGAMRAADIAALTATISAGLEQLAGALPDGRVC